MKYYVTCGNNTMIRIASTPEQACILAFRQWFSKDMSSIGSVFRVSQRGFDKHNDDKLFSSAVVIKLVRLSNQCNLGND